MGCAVPVVMLCIGQLLQLDGYRSCLLSHIIPGFDMVHGAYFRPEVSRVQGVPATSGEIRAKTHL